MSYGYPLSALLFNNETFISYRVRDKMSHLLSSLQSAYVCPIMNPT